MMGVIKRDMLAEIKMAYINLKILEGALRQVEVGAEPSNS